MGDLKATPLGRVRRKGGRRGVGIGNVIGCHFHPGGNEPVVLDISFIGTIEPVLATGFSMFFFPRLEDPFG